MAGLKHELDQWNEGVIAFDQGLYEDALEIFEPIADSAKIHFNIGVVLATVGDFEGASMAYEQATKLDQYLAIAYFQNGVANVALENYAKALTCFHDAYLYLRGNMVIDYTQLGLEFKLYSCQVLFNRALCYIELGEMDLGMTDLWRATREKQTKAHDILDQALRDKGRDCTVFTVPQGVLYRPAESKVKNSKKKDYLGNSKVIAAVDATDQFAGFKGMSAWQVQMSGPTNVAAIDEPRPMTPPSGLQRRATERNITGAGGAGARRGAPDAERPMLEHSASFNGMDASSRPGGGGGGRLGPGPSALGPGGAGAAGSEPSPRPSLLTRRNTEIQRPAPLNTEGNGHSPNGRGAGPASAAPGIGSRKASAGAGSVGSAGSGTTGRSRFQHELDEIEQHVYALSLESERTNNYQRNMVVSPIPSRSNSGNNVRPTNSVLRKPSQSSKPTSPSSMTNGNHPVPPVPYNQYGSTSPTQPPHQTMGSGRSSPANSPALAELRRMGSNGRGLSRDNSVRSTSSGGGFRSLPLAVNASPLGYSSSVSGRSDEGSYMEESAYAGLRDKLRVKCHYIDTRAVLVRTDTTLQELIQRVQEKFQSDRPLKLKYKDEDQHMLSMTDDEDWLMAKQAQMGLAGSLDRMELWCFDDE
ncbi:hypothetical protein EDD11_001803 [Mortierella claussenii]|nr:hypothetical protein EDD11_001803 [Mortierella claussenii]